MVKPKEKGHAAERAIAAKLKEVGYKNVRRRLEYQPEVCTGVDLDNTGPLKVQVKHRKCYVPVNTISEIKESGIPVLVTKANNKPDMCVLPLEHFLEVLKDAIEHDPHKWLGYGQISTSN